MEGFKIEGTEPTPAVEPIVVGGTSTIEQDESKAPSTIHGLSTEELNDVNKIRVTISDSSAPVVVLFGPASCGKTMTLIRLSRYLQAQGYVLQPDRNFRPSYDTNYKKLCDDFSDIINSSDAADRTSNISFMLVKVIKDGKTICQILEGPGELYFDPEHATQDWPTYVHELLNNTALRKIFVPFVEPNYSNENIRRNYVSTLNQLKATTGNQKYIFLHNKIDMTPFVIEPGKVHTAHAMHQVSCDYPNIFARFKNNNPITSLWRPYNFEYVPFQTGTYTKPASGNLVYIQGSDRYPMIFWGKLQNYIRG